MSAYPVPLDAGARLVQAPRFHNSRAWAERLHINSGIERVGATLIPRDDWRSPTMEELARLTGGPAVGDDDVALFHVPEYLRRRWWESPAPEGGPAFAAYAREMAEFLQFKAVPLPSPCTFEVRVSAPGRPTIRGTGLGGSWGEVGGINLGDAASSLVVLNLTPRQLQERVPGDGPPGHRFLEAYPGYPLVRVALLPGDGWLLPPCGLVADGDTRGMSEIDVTLLLRRPELLPS